MFSFFKKSKKIHTDKILVLGDSHSRAFSFNPNFFPIFLGPGKEMNFVNDKNLKLLEKSILRVLKTFNLTADSKIILYLGEPDTRFYLAGDWYPWKQEELELDENYKEKVRDSIIRYEKLLDTIIGKISNPIIMNVTPSRRTEQNKVVDYFNAKLAELCSTRGFEFLDINNSIYSNDEKVIQDVYYLDQVHMNTRIQVLVEKRLMDLAYIESPAYSKTELTNEEIQGKYGFDKRFGCYTLKA